MGDSIRQSKSAKIWYFVAGVIAGPIILGAMGWIYLTVKSDGFSARTPPAAIETKIAGLMRRTSLPRSAAEKTNPVKESPEVLVEAKAHWADHCAGCHGNDGAGKTQMGQQMYPPAPDMRQASTQRMSDGELFYVIENGVRLTGMPGWGSSDPGSSEQGQADSWKLVHFIRHLPALTQAELQQMEKLNPKTDAEREEEREEADFLNGGKLPPNHPEGHHHH